MGSLVVKWLGALSRKFVRPGKFSGEFPFDAGERPSPVSGSAHADGEVKENPAEGVLD